jgi:hypothetical protein
MAGKTDKIVNRQKKLEDKKTRWITIYRDIAANMIPLMEDTLQTQQSGTRQGSEIYDGTATFALNTLVKGLYGKMVNQASTWFKLRFRTQELNEIPEVKAWLQDTERHLYNVFNDSNFYDTIEGFLRDFAGFGTAIMRIEEDTGEGTLIFNNVNLNQCYIEQNFNGQVDLLHRKITSMQAKQILDFFGDDTPEIVKDAMKEDPFREFEVLHAVAPRELRDPTKINNQNMEFESVWILMGLTGDQKGNGSRSGNAASSNGALPAEIKESGFKKFPYIVGRWETNGIEEYGRSPAMYALADTMGINLMEKTLLELAEKVVNPPMNVFSGTEEDVNFMPYGINVIEGPEQAPHPTDIGGSGYPIGADQIARKEEFINKHFFVEAFLFLLSQGTDTRLTATEVVVREGENAMILGPIIGKVGGVLDQVIDQTFDKEFEAGRIAPPPAVIFEREGESIDIQYTGPLPQAQRIFFETSGITRSIESITAMAQLDPSVLDVPDFDEALRITLDANGWPQKATNSREDVEEKKARKAQLEQQALELQAGQAQATTIKDLAKADKDSGGQVTEAFEEQQA